MPWALVWALVAASGALVSAGSSYSPRWFSLDPDNPRVHINRFQWGDLLEENGISRKSSSPSDWRRALRKETRRRRPFVIENSPVMDWPAIDKWKSEEYLINKMPRAAKVRRGVHPVFVYEDNTRLLGKENILEPGTPGAVEGQRQPFLVHRSTTRFKYVNMSTRSFLKKSTRQNSAFHGIKNYYYFSRRISESPSILPLIRDAHPRSFLQFIGGDRNKTMSNPEGRDEHFWMGGPGISASTHYDRDHNLFAQCVGEKRFVFWEPGMWPELSVHPFYHPRDRQSQTVYSEHDEELSGKGERGGSTDIPPYGYVDLKPGDLLYIPPFWWHRVQSTTLSIGINVWTAALESSMASTLNDLGLPKLVSKRTGKISIAATAFFIRGLVETLQKSNILNWSQVSARTKENTPATTPLRFISSIIESRYIDLGLSQRIAAFDCQHWDEKRCPKTHAFEASEISGIKIYGDKIINYALSTVSKIKKHDKNGLHIHGIIGTIIGDYIERVATYAVGPNRACSFLRCVGYEGGWKTLKFDDDGIQELRDGQL